MAFFISYTLSALGHDISLRADRLKRWYMNEDWLKGMIYLQLLDLHIKTMYFLFYNYVFNFSQND
jgi:hypothetical protein